MMLATVLALLPVTLLIAFGHVLRRVGFMDDGFWPQAERLCYYVLLPALFLHGLGTADLAALPVAAMAVVLAGATLAGAAVALLARPLAGGDGASYTSTFQGSIRFNNYIGVALAAGLLGAEGIALAAVCTAVAVPLVNLLSVLVFARFGSVRLTGAQALGQIARNPLVLASLGGIALQASGLALPPGVEPALRSLGAASMPLGLMCVGAALSFRAVGAGLRPLAVASGVKFVCLPLVAFALLRLIGVSGSAAVVALMFQALPTASSAYILSRQMGGDAPLMAAIIAAQTLLAALAIPLALSLLAL